MKQLANYINGRFVPPQSGEYFPSLNPATGEAIAQVPDSDQRDIDLAVKSSQYAFHSWSELPVRERSRILYKISDLILAQARDLAQAESMDQGKPISLALALDIPRAAENFRFFAGHCEFAEERATHMDQAINYTLRRPVGVAGLISPWNLPLYLLTWKIAPALAYGNTAVAKPSELTPMTAHLLAEIFSKADLPPGVCNIIQGTGVKAGAPLAAHPGVPLISFTGGTATGHTIQQAASPHFKKLSLELGGKNPNIIFADCDFDLMLENTVRSSFLNQGEICLCGSRIYVEKSLYDKFLEALVSAARSLPVGDPLDRSTFMGPLVSAEHLAKVKSYLELAKQEGGTLVTGGDRPQLRDEFAKGNFLNPTVVTGLANTCRTVQEEIFGPVVTVHPFENDAEAVQLANDVRYGLSATVWTRDLARAHHMAAQLQAATVWVNTWMLRDLRMPFGGMKASGVGREGGEHSHDFYTETKTVCIKY